MTFDIKSLRFDVFASFEHSFSGVYEIYFIDFENEEVSILDHKHSILETIEQEYQTVRGMPMFTLEFDLGNFITI
jgi:hypothetical protein